MILMQDTRGPTNGVVRRQICISWPDYHNGQFGQCWRFGPCYLEKELKEEVDDRQEEKQLALDIVLEKSGSTRSDLYGRLRDSEEEARATYHEFALKDIDEDKFREMMAIDGCFYLLVAFSILGEGMDGFKLEFPDNHRFFGLGCVEAVMEMWLNSMFFVGNQIPFVVLEQLMELSFFKELVIKNKWKQPLELAKRAVHMLLMTDPLDQKPVDLMHCLHTCVLGTKTGSDVTIPIMGNNVGDEVDDLPSAEELLTNGIAIAALEKDRGSRGIYYEHGPFSGVLYLPVFKVDRYTALVVECLRKYETAQKDSGIKPEATSFLKLLSELIRTEEDVKLFSSQRVILGRAEGLPQILNKFDGRESCNCEHLRHVRRQIKSLPPQRWWISIKRMIVYIRRNPCRCFICPLQFLQTYFTVLACYKARS